MPVLFMGYDVASNSRRRAVRRSIQAYLPALQKSALQGDVLPHELRPLLWQTYDCLDETQDGLVLSRLLSHAPSRYSQLPADAQLTGPQPGLLIIR